MSKNLHCPNCFVELTPDTLAAACEDDATREYLGLFNTHSWELLRPLSAYIGLFRPKKSRLSWSRALKLAQEVLAMDDVHGSTSVAGAGRTGATNDVRMSAALIETTEAMRVKQREGRFKPLTNHNYLLRVLESLPASIQPATASGESKTPVIGQSKTAQARAALDAHAGPGGDIDPRFVKLVCDGLKGWLLLGLEGQPAADLITEVADDWITYLWTRRDWNDLEKGYVGKLRHGFVSTGQDAKRWPNKKDVLTCVPNYTQ